MGFVIRNSCLRKQMMRKDRILLDELYAKNLVEFIFD